MATTIVFEVSGTGKEKEASEKAAVEVIKQQIRQLAGLQANVECCEVLDVKTERAYERVARYSKGTA